MRSVSTQASIDAAHPAVDPVDAVQVLRQFRVIFNAVRAHFQEVEKRAGMGGALVWALHAIHSQPGLTVNGLAQAMDIHQSTASNLVRQLLKRQLIRSEKSSVDRRVVSLYVEPAALTVLETVPGPFEGVLPKALGQLPGQTLHLLHTQLGVLIAAMQADEKAAHTPLSHL